MPSLTITVDYHATDSLPPEPLWTATDPQDPDSPWPVDVWCLMWRAGSTAALRSVRTGRTFFCTTWLRGPQFEEVIAVYMAQTLGCLVSTSKELVDAA